MVESVDNDSAAGPTIRTMSSVAEPAAPPPPQELRFCRAADGTRIAYATHGSGPPLVVASCSMSHLQFDWQSPVWRHFLEALGEIATVIRYDERGHGLSDWDVDDFSTEARLSDLEAVVDDAGVDQFALLAMSQGGPIAIDVRGPPSRACVAVDLLQQLRGGVPRRHARGSRDGGCARPAHEGRLGAPDTRVPPGVHVPDDSRCQ